MASYHGLSTMVQLGRGGGVEDIVERSLRAALFESGAGLASGGPGCPAPTWGESLEVMHATAAASRWVRPVEDYAGCVLLMETSEELPSATKVFPGAA
ncbi:hypothetical protein GCM10010435_42780 [Winogradskya consettensis]|uniref:Uncharacterized protein n=1 Tax=Winogradskya consettensis TaxID=113560 RepID=A0A919SVU4_9ACTN|nr:hypothetical protein [Actinoplanes consettensis]GIM77958.1 hypothetical protein Aco04nite_57990 [Actinoplanes consettensis]